MTSDERKKLEAATTDRIWEARRLVRFLNDDEPSERLAITYAHLCNAHGAFAGVEVDDTL